MKNRLEYIVFVFFSLIFRIIGLNNARRAGKLIGVIFFRLIPIRRETVISNLKLAFPEKTDSQIKHVASEVYKSFGISLAEILSIPSLSREDAAKIVQIDNLERVKFLYEQGKGLILMSAHYGNWEYMAISTGVQINIPVSSIAKPQRNPYVTDYMNKVRSKFGNKTVPLGISVRQIYKELKDKNIVAMIADQRGPVEGIRINFMGRPAAVYAGPAALAVKTGAPMMIGIAVRQKDYSYKAVMYEINTTSDLPEDDEAKIFEISRRHTEYLEKIIREHPEQWLWMHKRWKY